MYISVASGHRADPMSSIFFWGDEGRAIVALSVRPDRRGGWSADPGLVGVHLKCMLTVECFTISRNWQTLGGICPSSVPKAQMYKASKYKNK